MVFPYDSIILLFNKYIQYDNIYIKMYVMKYMRIYYYMRHSVIEIIIIGMIFDWYENQIDVTVVILKL